MNHLSDQAIRRTMIFLLILSASVRAFLAGFLELGNDEVYYWTYALYPDLSHFDHPPMVGWLIQLFTCNLLLDAEFFLRLPAIVLGTVNTWIVFQIGISLKNKITGLFAAFVFTASIYGFLISGTFILPDTPQVFFWLLSMLCFVGAFFGESHPKRRNMLLILAGITAGFGMLSKYTTIFLWAGVIIYVILHDRKWLRRVHFYLALAVSMLFFIPVILWNSQHDWISFTYQGSRANLFASGIHLNQFITELTGQIFYNNPFVVLIIILSLFAVIRRNDPLPAGRTRFLLWISLPLVLVFLFLSLFRGTLPHWSAPGYLGLYVLAAAFIDERPGQRIKKKLFPSWVQVPVYFLLIVLMLGTGQVKGGWLYYDDSEDPRKLGKNDVSLDMYGWRQLDRLYDIPELPIVAHRWFPAANLDYYVARPRGIDVLALGDLASIHKYAWINEQRGGFTPGMDAVYITFSRDYKDPADACRDYFQEIVPLDTIPIMRNERHVQNVFIYRLENLKKIPGPLW